MADRAGGGARVGLATCAALPSGDPDDRYLTDAFTRAGIGYSWIEWNSADPKVLGDNIDMLILRSPWDYPEHHERFLSWLDAIEIPVYNSPGVVRWNSNKSYLLDLADAGSSPPSNNWMATHALCRCRMVSPNSWSSRRSVSDPWVHDDST